MLYLCFPLNLPQWVYKLLCSLDLSRTSGGWTGWYTFQMVGSLCSLCVSWCSNGVDPFWQCGRNLSLSLSTIVTTGLLSPCQARLMLFGRVARSGKSVNGCKYPTFENDGSYFPVLCTFKAGEIFWPLAMSASCYKLVSQICEKISWHYVFLFTRTCMTKCDTSYQWSFTSFFN